MNQPEIKKEILNFCEKGLCENALEALKKYVESLEIDNDLKKEFTYDIGFIIGRLTGCGSILM